MIGTMTWINQGSKRFQAMPEGSLIGAPLLAPPDISPILPIGAHPWLKGVS